MNKTVFSIFAILLFAASLFAQPSISLDVPYVSPGTPATVKVVMHGGGMNPACAQMSMTVPNGSVVTPGTILTGAQKSLYFFQDTTGVLTMLWCDGTGPIPDGTIATIGFTAVPYQFNPFGAVAVDAQALPMQFSVTGFNFGSSCDLNGDGKIDNADKTIAVDQATHKAACVSADLNGDGKCNAIDVQRINNAINGGVCKVGQ